MDEIGRRGFVLIEKKATGIHHDTVNDAYNYHCPGVENQIPAGAGEPDNGDNQKDEDEVEQQGSIANLAAVDGVISPTLETAFSQRSRCVRTNRLIFPLS